MNRHKYIMPVLIWTVFLCLTACSNHSGDKSLTDKIITDSSSTASQQTNSATTDSLTMQKDELTKIYTQAIAAFIKAVNEKHKTSFDTLFFGKHVYGQPDDFPDIELPRTIENTQIRLISPEDGLKKQKARKSLVYVNMVGWVGQDKAEFIFVTFSNGCKHQYDCFINYKYDAQQKEFDLDKLRFEYYLYKNKP